MDSIFDKIPNISFIEGLTLKGELEQLISDYQEKYREITGNDSYVLPAASPYRLILNAVALHLYQGYMWLEQMGKQNMLKYATGNYLDQLGLAFGITRKKGEKAKTNIRFTLSAMQPSTVIIPKFTRCTDGNIYFATTRVAEIPSGQLHIDIPAECTDIGKVGNGFEAGVINILVDAVPYINTVSNTTKTDYGTDVESDDDFRYRIYNAPATYSAAGPVGAYEYFVKEYSSLVTDVKITNPAPRVVDIRVVLKDGQLPDNSFCEKLTDYLFAPDKKPLTDVIQVKAPEQIDYKIDLKYFINVSDKTNAKAIQESVDKAVKDYVAWQGSKIGRDVNPSQLTRFMTNAGAKRIEINSPVFTKVEATKIPYNRVTPTVIYGGMEDD